MKWHRCNSTKVKWLGYYILQLSDLIATAMKAGLPLVQLDKAVLIKIIIIIIKTYLKRNAIYSNWNCNISLGDAIAHNLASPKLIFQFQWA